MRIYYLWWCCCALRHYMTTVLNICALTSDLFMAQFRHGLCVCAVLCWVWLLCACAYNRARVGLSLYFTQTMSVCSEIKHEKSVESRERETDCVCEREKERENLIEFRRFLPIPLRAHKSVLEAKVCTICWKWCISHHRKRGFFSILYMVFVWAHACIWLFFRTILAFSPFLALSLSLRIRVYMQRACMHIMIIACDSLRVQIYSRCLFFRSKWARAVYDVRNLFIIYYQTFNKTVLYVSQRVYTNTFHVDRGRQKTILATFFGVPLYSIASFRLILHSQTHSTLAYNRHVIC